MVRYKVTLTLPERDRLMQIIKKGSRSTQTYRNANILLNCDEGYYSDKITNAEIVRALKVGMRTIDRVKRRFGEAGLNRGYTDRQASGHMRKRSMVILRHIL